MSSGATIGFVYFDLGKILLDFDFQIACRNIAELLGVTPKHVQATVYDSGLEDRFERGELSPEEFNLAVSKAVGIAGTPPPVAALMDAISDMFTPIDAMVEVMDHVRTRVRESGGRGIGILSNTCHGHWDWVMRQAYQVMVAEMDATILSYQVGAMKPSPKIYEVAEAAAGVPASQILFIDDKQENVDAAIARGWHARQCFGGPGAISVLTEFGVF